MLKVLFASPRERVLIDLAQWDQYASVQYLKENTEASLLDLIVNVDVLVTSARGVPITKQVLEAATQLKLIQTFSVGYDNIDATTATQRGIIVCNTGGSNAESVAELAWGLILAVSRRIPAGDHLMRTGGWGRVQPETHRLVWEKTLGVIGFGAIGRLVGKIGRFGFNMQLLASDPFIIPETVELFGGTLVALDTVLREADVVSIHVPLSPATRHLIGEPQLRLMKSSAILVNTARGAVIDEAALITCLRDGVIAGAGLDVFEEEPLAADSPLRAMENVVLLSHIGSCPDAIVRMRRVGVENVTRFLRGQPPLRIVNPNYRLHLPTP